MLKRSKQKPKTNAYDNALRLLAMREHSEQQIRSKLEQREYDHDEIESAIEQLKSEHYLSDLRFAESYIRSRKQKLYGEVRIRLELKERGVSGEVINLAIQADEDEEGTDWYQVMSEAYHKKYGDTRSADYNDKAKRCRYLQNRGFAPSMITDLVE